MLIADVLNVETMDERIARHSMSFWFLLTVKSAVVTLRVQVQIFLKMKMRIDLKFSRSVMIATY